MTNPTEYVCVGPMVKPETRRISGQAMMFQLLVDFLSQNGHKVNVIDIGETTQARNSARLGGRFAWRRAWQYWGILSSTWQKVITRRCIVYLTSAQSLWGFVRDFAIIWVASCMRRTIAIHQFGAHYGQFYSSQSVFVRFLIRLTLARTSVIIVEGESVKQQFTFLKDWDRLVYVVANGLPDRSVVVPSSPKLLNPAQPLHLLYLSNMIETKGYWDVLEACNILINLRGQKVYCEFVGNFAASIDDTRFPNAATAHANFVEYLQQHHLVNLVSHTDYLFGDAKAAAFKRCHIFLLPSNYINEGQPTAILEAMAYGLVVVATAHGLIPSMVQEGHTGYLVQYGHPEQIADRVEFLMRNPEIYQQLSKAAQDLFVQEFSTERYIARISEILQMIISEPALQ